MNKTIPQRSDTIFQIAQVIHPNLTSDEWIVQLKLRHNELNNEQILALFRLIGRVSHESAKDIADTRGNIHGGFIIRI